MTERSENPIPNNAAETRGRSVLVVSPHYDDVPLSLGQSLLDGALADAARVEVRVVFGRTNWSVKVHPTRRRAPAVTAARRIEEAVAARRFGYRVRAADLEEVILRNGSLAAETFRGEDDISSDPLLGRIEALCRSWHTEADLLWMPAGIGRHVDHRLVAQAGANMVRAGATRMAFYEDRPYTAYMDDDEIASEVSSLELRMQPHAVSGPILERTQRRVRRIYRSQMVEYFVTAQERDREAGRTERVWTPSESP